MKIQLAITKWLKLLAFSITGLFTFNTVAQTTAFTYQGRLNNTGIPANGSYDLRFGLFDAATSGTQQGNVLTNPTTGVSNGLFTVTLDFGGQFNGANRWLEIGVRSNGVGAFSTLTPRQWLTPVPYAVYASAAGSAATASTAGSVPASGIGAGTANINITGNAGTAISAAVAGAATSATTATTALTALTAGTATNLIGNVADAQLSANIVRLNGTNVFTGTNTFTNVVIATNPANQIAGTFTGSGAGLTGLSAISLAAGSITADKLAPGAVSSLGALGGSPTNAVQVDTNGLVGIGTTTPAAGLQITTGALQTILPVLYEVQNNKNGYTNLNNPYCSAVNNNLLAIGGASGVTLVNIAYPSSPTLQSQIVNGTGVFTNLYQTYGAAWAGSNLVVGAAGSSAVTIISCANPASPVKLAELRNGVGGWNYLSSAYGVAVSGNLLAIAANGSSAVTLADISNPSAPVWKSSMVNGTFGFTNLSGAISVALSGNLLAIGAYGGSAVTLVNVADPSNPQKLAELRYGVGGYTNLAQITSVALSGNLLAIGASGSSVVTLVEVSNPASPVKLAELRNGVGGYSLSGARSVSLSGNLLAIAALYSSTVTLVDVSNPANPVLLATATDGLNGADYLNGAAGIAFAGTNLVATGFYDNGFILMGIGTQAVGLDSAGWVGIGTTHPQAALDVVGNVLVENATLFEVSAVRVAMGVGANASGSYSTALGSSATASGYGSAALANGSTASGTYSTALGTSATASGTYSTALGNSATASGDYSTALGYYATASGTYSTALGFYSQATNYGCLVWSDSSTYPGASSTSDNSLTFRASGGFRLFSNSGMTAGASLPANGTSWAVISDRNAKKDFAPIDPVGILNKLAAMPVTQWRYKWEGADTTPHIGPMAQDFKAAFYPGTDDKSITTLEADGVELAAIQGLNQKLHEKDAEIRQLKEKAAEVDSLERRLGKLEQMVRALAPAK